MAEKQIEQKFKADFRELFFKLEGVTAVPVAAGLSRAVFRRDNLKGRVFLKSLKVFCRKDINLHLPRTPVHRVGSAIEKPYLFCFLAYERLQKFQFLSYEVFTEHFGKGNLYGIGGACWRPLSRPRWDETTFAGNILEGRQAPDDYY
jgi:hypothetical protein